MTNLEVLDEVQRWTPRDKWMLVDVLLGYLRAEHTSTNGAPSQRRTVSTTMGPAPVVAAAVLLDADSLFDFDGDAVVDAERLYD